MKAARFKIGAGRQKAKWERLINKKEGKQDQWLVREEKWMIWQVTGRYING